MFVSNNGIDNFLFQNNGDGTFTKITDSTIVNDGGASRGAAWGDYDNDGYLDIFVSNGNQNNFLYRNDGPPNYTFTKIVDGDIVNDGGFSIGCNWGDYNNDGYLDLFVNNFGGDNFLYRNNGDATFTRITIGEIVSDGGFSTGS